MQVVNSIDAPNNPRAVAVTNNGDTNDDDETLAVTEYFGEPNADLSACPNGTAEVCDTGRGGRVRLYNLGTLSPQAPILFNPIDSGFAPAGSAPGTASVMTSPNQLSAVAIQGNRIYVTSVSASPQAPIKFNANVFPVLYVGNLDAHLEDRSNVGSANLAKLANDALGDGPGTDRFFLGDIADLALAPSVPGTQVAYVASRAADVVQRVNYDPTTGTTIGAGGVQQIDLAPGCQNPIGVVLSNDGTHAYVNCWITRGLGVIDLATQTLVGTTPSTDPPAAGTAAESVHNGPRPLVG